MLLFAFTFPPSVFALFTVGRPVEFNVLVFDTSGASSFLGEAPEGRMLSAGESLKDSVKNGVMVATGKSLESVSFAALARCSSLIRAGQSFDHDVWFPRLQSHCL
jgi:hypothetical protein